MKAKTFFCALAATMMLFAACGKDDEETNSANNSNSQQVNIADNTLVYDGVTYQLEAQFAYPNNSMGWLMIQSVEKDVNEEPIIRMPHDEIHLYSYLVGQTIDLTQIFREWPGYEFALEGAVNWMFGSYEVNDETYIGGTIEGTDYDNVTPFKSGSTMKITVENDTFTLVINAESKNGHQLNLRVVTSANGWQPSAE